MGPAPSKPQECKRHVGGPSKTKGDLAEFSVVYTDRAVNLMSAPFGDAMTTIRDAMKNVYNAHSIALIPGSGTYAMESVARQFGQGQTCACRRAAALLAARPLTADPPLTPPTRGTRVCTRGAQAS